MLKTDTDRCRIIDVQGKYALKLLAREDSEINTVTVIG